MLNGLRSIAWSV